MTIDGHKTLEKYPVYTFLRLVITIRHKPQLIVTSPLKMMPH